MSTLKATAPLGRSVKSLGEAKFPPLVDLTEIASYLASLAPVIAGNDRAARTLIVETAAAIRCQSTGHISLSVTRALDDSVAYCRRHTAERRWKSSAIDHGLRMMIVCNALRDPDYTKVLRATYKAFLADTNTQTESRLLETAVRIRQILTSLRPRTIAPEFA